MNIHIDNINYIRTYTIIDQREIIDQVSNICARYPGRLSRIVEYARKYKTITNFVKRVISTEDGSYMERWRMLMTNTAYVFATGVYLWLFFLN